MSPHGPDLVVVGECRVHARATTEPGFTARHVEDALQARVGVRVVAGSERFGVDGRAKVAEGAERIRCASHVSPLVVPCCFGSRSDAV